MLVQLFVPFVSTIRRPATRISFQPAANQPLGLPSKSSLFHRTVARFHHSSRSCCQTFIRDFLSCLLSLYCCFLPRLPALEYFSRPLGLRDKACDLSASGYQTLVIADYAPQIENPPQNNFFAILHDSVLGPVYIPQIHGYVDSI